MIYAIRIEGKGENPLMYTDFTDFVKTLCTIVSNEPELKVREVVEIKNSRYVVLYRARS